MDIYFSSFLFVLPMPRTCGMICTSKLVFRSGCNKCEGVSLEAPWSRTRRDVRKKDCIRDFESLFSRH